MNPIGKIVATNQLPKPYRSWLEFVADLKERQIPPETKEVLWEENAISDSGFIKIEIDYAKARAFEEIGKIPSKEDCHKAWSILSHAVGAFYSKPDDLKDVKDMLENLGKKMWYAGV